MNRLRVLHVVQNLGYGGMERVFADLVRRLDPSRFDSHVLVLSYFGVNAEGLDAFATMHPPFPQGRLSLLRPAAFAHVIREIAPAVVHSHQGVWYKTARAARLAGVPWVVHTEHGRQHPDPWTARLIGHLASRLTDVVVPVSQVLLDQMARSVVAHPERLVLVENGIDTDAYAPRPDDGRLRAELRLGPEVPIIGRIGRLEPIKGYDVMVEAYGEFRRQWAGHPMPVLVIAGDGSQREALLARARELGISDGVHLLGWRDDTTSLLSAFSLFSLGSRSEGTSIGVLEAMSAGRCPVVTDVGGNAWVLGEALRHRLVPPVDPPAMARAWRDVLEGDAQRARDVAAGRARVLEQFGLDATVRKYETLYQRALPR